MTAQEYIQSKLNDLRTPQGLQAPHDADELVEAIVTALLSKKFRKYSANPELIDHVYAAVRMHVEKNEPINITFFHGAYKLWRLEESPEPDWAELFSLMYYSNWVKPVCELYAPGVWFDFFVDDTIVPKLNNVPLEDIQTYISSYQKLMDFLKAYQPANLNMTITPVSSQFPSAAAFEESLQRNLEQLTNELPDGLPSLSDADKATIELNVRTTDEQLKDPKWREKVSRLHDAYMRTKAEPGYHKNRADKILAFVQPLPSGVMLSVGTTKDSIMKFWVGVGVLKRREDSFRQIIMSWQQLQTAEFATEDVHVEGLSGKNFGRIRII
jgi:hypothetical protein